MHLIQEIDKENNNKEQVREKGKRMKTEEEYRLAEIRKNNDIKENAKYSHEPELVKIMEGVKKDGLERLINSVITLNNLKEIKEEISNYKVSVTERNLDLLLEFLSLNENNVKEVNEYWLKEFKLFGKNILLYNIEIKEGYGSLKTDYVQNKYSLFLKPFQLLNDLK